MSTTAKRAVKNGSISYIIPAETTVAIVRLDGKVVGCIKLYTEVGGRAWFVYIPRGYRGPRETLPMYNNFTACKEAIEAV